MIVGSILLAFGIDASWDARRNRQDEQQILRGLEAEFVDLEATLEGRAVRYERIVQDIELLLDSVPTMTDLPLPQLDSAMMNLTFDGTFDLGAGTLASVVASGRLELIGRQELRDRLAGWQRLMDDVVDNEIIMKTFIATVLVPVMASKELQVGRGRSSYFRGWALGLDGAPEATQRYREAFVDPELTSLAQYRYAWALSSLWEHRETAEAAREVLRLIRAETR